MIENHDSCQLFFKVSAGGQTAERSTTRSTLRPLLGATKFNESYGRRCLNYGLRNQSFYKPPKNNSFQTFINMLEYAFSKYIWVPWCEELFLVVWSWGQTRIQGEYFEWLKETSEASSMATGSKINLKSGLSWCTENQNRISDYDLKWPWCLSGMLTLHHANIATAKAKIHILEWGKTSRSFHLKFRTKPQIWSNIIITYQICFLWSEAALTGSGKLSTASRNLHRWAVSNAMWDLAPNSEPRVLLLSIFYTFAAISA